jgi:hypothetical protein
MQYGYLIAYENTKVGPEYQKNNIKPYQKHLYQKKRRDRTA